MAVNPPRFLALILLLTACSSNAKPPPKPIRVDGYVVSHQFPHDRGAFTEGLFFADGFLYESTGLERQSTIRKVRIADGKVVKVVQLPDALFGEGIVNWANEIVSVTWQTGVGLRWDRGSLRQKSRFHYPGEGWGMTQDGSNLILSDGTPVLRFLDPLTFKERRKLNVTINGFPLRNINELEWVKGEIFANVWLTNRIAVIDPVTGAVKRVIDLTPLAAMIERKGSNDVLNGIAYDARTDRLWVTGKNWPVMFELKRDVAPPVHLPG
jgi:glutaminyl-peptide cyclotransferase